MTQVHAKLTLSCTSASLSLLLLSCTTGLRPADHALHPVDQEQAVLGEERGVRVIAVADPFPGDAHIEAEVTPLLLTIVNKSGVSLFIRYSSFRLETSTGSAHPAIPPRQITGTVPSAEALPPNMGFTGFSGFEVAPYYRGLYPGTAAYRGPFDYDAAYYDNNYGYWRTTTQLPTTEMLNLALPEGALHDGGELNGYLYFPLLEHEPGTEVILSAHLKRADGASLQLRLPFVVR